MISFQADTAPVDTYDLTSPDLRGWVEFIEMYAELPNVSPVLFGEFTIDLNQERDEEPSNPIDQSAILSILREDS